MFKDTGDHDHEEITPEPVGADSLPTISAASTGQGEESSLAGVSLDLPCEIDDFVLLEEVGRGGMGTVYRAHEKRLERVVALKALSLRIAGDASIAKRFRREAILAANLSHPNIVPVHYVDDRECPRYFTMDFIQGRSLKEKVQEEGFLDPDEVIRIAMQACDALAHAHERNIVHRDIKPSNILLENHVERVRITDFGIAQDMSGSLAEVTVTEGMTFGTPAFMSPEQNLGERVDHRTDIFSLGLTLYYTLTGCLAYRADSRPALAVAFRTQSPTPPSQINSKVPPALDRIILRMIEPDLEIRYGDISQVVADLSQCGPTLKGFVRRSKGTRRRARRAWLFVGSAMVAVLVGGVLWMWPGFVGKRPSPPPDAPSPDLALRIMREINMPGVITRWRPTLFGDWDGDGEVDLFICNSTDVFVVSTDGQVLGQERISKGQAGSPTLGLVQDVDGDGRDEVFVGWAEGETLIISVRNQNFYELKRFTAKGSVYTGAGGQNLMSHLSAIALEDLDGDGQRELVACINTAYGRTPRGIRCFDFETEELLWGYDTGAAMHKVTVSDLDGDGDKEIIFGTAAVGNGNVASDRTDDMTSYVCALSHEGNLLWIVPLGPFSTSATPIPVDFDGDGRQEILAWVIGDPIWAQQSPPVVLLNGEGDLLRRYNPGDLLTDCQVVDMGGDGMTAVLLADQNGECHVLSQDLALQTVHRVVTSPYDRVELSIGGASDLDGDGDMELAFSSTEREDIETDNPGYASRPKNVFVYHNNQVIVLDKLFKPESTVMLSERWKEHVSIGIEVGPFLPGGGNGLFVLADKASLVAIGSGEGSD